MTAQESGAWHSNVISASTESALSALRNAKLLDGFYLAGGTALALHYGHRLSLDLDFFAREHFDEEGLLVRLRDLPGFALMGKAPYTLHTTVGNTKVSFLGYAYSMLYPTSPFLGVAVADPRDLACMKVSALAGRGTKRDFIDLYVASQRLGLAPILDLFATKFAQTNYSRLHLLKSLAFFADAEKDPMPHMLVDLDWDTVKQFFLREAPRLL